MNRFQELAYVHKHRKMVQKLAKEKGYSFPFHDLHKMFNILIFGDKIATKMHRRFSKHHLHNGDIKNKIEAAFDWESARFTKPDKPLDAYDTWKKYYAEVDMEATLKLLGLYRGDINEE